MHSWYSAFGVSDKEEPHGVQHQVYEDPLPQEELTDSVGHILVEDHGDMPGQKFIRVDGVDEVKVTEAWKRVRNIVHKENWWQNA